MFPCYLKEKEKGPNYLKGSGEESCQGKVLRAMGLAFIVPHPSPEPRMP